MIELPSLYDHQTEQKDRVRAALAKHRRVIMCAGCGVGKTMMSKWILGSSMNRQKDTHASGKSLFVVQGRPLVGNASESFNKEPKLPHGIIMSGRDTAYGRPIQVASIDTMLSWFVAGGEYPSDITFDLIIHDECDSHFSKFARFLQYHDARREALNLHPAYGIGLSATPSATGLADVYKDIVFGPSTEYLIDNDYLSPFRYFMGKQGQLEKLIKRGGEFTKASECEAMDGLAGDLVRDWKQFGDGRPTVGFFPRRSHAKDAMAKLTEAGLRVEYVDANTPDEERWSSYRALDRHDIDYLCNVNLVGRGTDIPAISCVQLCVAIASVKAFLQKVGRGSRFNAETYPEKRDCCVIDHGANVKRHGYFEDPRHWSLDITTKNPGEVGPRPTIECPKCKTLYRGGECKACGYKPTTCERRGQGLEFDGSELKEIKRKESTAKSRSAKQIMVAALYKAGRSGRTWRQCCGMFKALCQKEGTNYRVPSTVVVGAHRYNMLRFGSPDSNRRVSALFPFTTGSHGGDYLITETAASEVAPY